jgi:hypothetical protein
MMSADATLDGETERDIGVVSRPVNRMHQRWTDRAPSAVLAVAFSAAALVGLAARLSN